ncbi:hypothetical protein ABQE62_31500, partial [Mycolicibacterium fortuitum]
ASLLPALQLARVDGLSPLEYLTADLAELVRTTARGLVRERLSDLNLVCGALAAAYGRKPARG